MMASALIRRVQAESGFAAVVAKGDPQSGAMVVIAAEKGRISGLFERTLGLSNRYQWTRFGPQDTENKDEIDGLLSRRRQRDPDLWIIELDIADAERFIVESDDMG